MAAIATVELPNGQWPELVELLLSFMGQSNVNLRVATLQAIGFICESIVRPIFLDQEANFLTVSPGPLSSESAIE